MLITRASKSTFLWISALTLYAGGAASSAGGQLEEVVVTAQKREQSLQDVPIAVSALSQEGLKALGVDNLGDLSAGYLPSLKVQPYFNGPSMLVLSMRGVGSADPEQITKEMGVGVYIDGVYLGRTQGLSTSLVDLERIEVLRGPQGTLYGRNSLGGAVNLISRRPEGELGFEQTFSFGSYGRLKSLSHLDVAVTDTLAAKISYLHKESDGWVDNDFPGAENFYHEDSDGARVALAWSPTDNITVDYAYERSDIETGMGYFQYTDLPELAPGFTFFDPSLIEDSRREDTRFGVPLEPTVTESEAHTLIAEWQLSDTAAVKSITSFRTLDEDLFTNYGGVFATGLNIQRDTAQEQWSQELQLLGNTPRLDYVIGAYWFEEQAEMDNREFGTIAFKPPTGPNAIPVAVAPELIVLDPGTRVTADTESWALFGQASWLVPGDMLQDRLKLTMGLRYTHDQKDSVRNLRYGFPDTSTAKFDADRVDPMLSVSWQWTENFTSYLKWASAYRAGGTNLRSSAFSPYDEEELTSTELGIKSEWLDSRVRINAALFNTSYEDKQLDFPNPLNPVETATINATNGDVEISGLELEMDAMLTDALRVSLRYNYLDADIERQSNPFTGTLDRFEVQSAPRHSGSLQLQYDFPETAIGAPRLSVTYTSSDDYYQNPQNFAHNDGWDLLHARFALADIQLGSLAGAFEVALWGNNLTDEEYITNGVSQAISNSALYGEPRTYGIDLSYRY